MSYNFLNKEKLSYLLLKLKSLLRISDTASGLNPILSNSTSAPIISIQINGATEQLIEKYLTSLTETASTVNYAGADTNMIPCKANDVFVITCDTERVIVPMIQSASGLVMFDDRDLTPTKTKTVTATSSNKAIGFRIQGATATENVTITVNGSEYNNPSPTNEVPIHGIGESGILEVKTAGKNIFDLANAEWTDKYNASNIITVEDNELTMSGLWYNGTKIKLKPNTDYFISADYTTDNSGEHTGKIAIKLGNESTDLNVSKDGYTFNSGEHTEVLLRFYASNSTSGTTTWTNIQLEEGTVQTDYEPHTATTANIPLSAPLYEKDYIEYRMDGSGEVSRKQVEMVLNGKETWSTEGSGDTTYYAVQIGAYGSVVDNKIKCTHFVQKAISSGNTNIGINVLNSPATNKARIAVRPSIDGVTNLATWKAWLAENEPKAVYEITELTVTPLTAEQITEFEKLRTFDGVTNVSCEGEVAYFRDNVNGKIAAMLSKKIDNKKASFETLSYADYKAGKYDPTKSYHIPDYPYSTGKAKDIEFDDSVAKTGSNNVQGAIESVKGRVDQVEENTKYSDNGGSYIGTNEYGNIQQMTVAPNENVPSPIFNNQVLQEHDAALERIVNDLYSDSLTKATSLHVNFISTNTNTKVTIKFKSLSAWGFLFGRTSGSNTICASIAYSAVTKLGAGGEFTANSGTITMTLNTYAMCFLLHNGNIESITYS